MVALTRTGLAVFWTTATQASRSPIEDKRMPANEMGPAAHSRMWGNGPVLAQSRFSRPTRSPDSGILFSFMRTKPDIACYFERYLNIR